MCLSRSPWGRERQNGEGGIWPSGWQWQPSQPEYEQMILGLYATLGVFLVLASRDPVRHRSLIQFAAWSSLVHAGIMAVQALRDPSETGHLVGDVPVLAVVGVVLLALLPRRVDEQGSSADRVPALAAGGNRPGTSPGTREPAS